MNRIAVSKELVAIAKLLNAIDFPTQDAMKKYLKDHPDADKSNHKVVKTEPQQKAPEQKGKKAPKDPIGDKFALSDMHEMFQAVGFKRLQGFPDRRILQPEGKDGRYVHMEIKKTDKGVDVHTWSYDSENNDRRYGKSFSFGNDDGIEKSVRQVEEYAKKLSKGG